MDSTNERKKYSSIPCMRFSLLGNLVDFKELCNIDDATTTIINYVYKKSGDSPLLLAARYGHKDLLEFLLRNGVDMEHKNLDGKRALHEACFSGCLKCVEILLEQNVVVDPLKHGDWTPLMIASTHGYVDIVKKLIQYGANVQRLNKDGWNAFHLAARKGHIKVLECLLEDCMTLWDTVSKNGRTPLHTACMHGKAKTVEFLLQSAHYESDMKDSCGTTPFMDASRFNFVDILDLLCRKQNVDFNVVDSIGRNALHVACQSGAVEAVQYLVSECRFSVNHPCQSSLLKPLHIASKEGHIKVVRYLVSFGADVNAIDKSNRTSLHLAAASGKPEVVQYFVDSVNVDCNMLDMNGKIALDLALNFDCKMILSSIS